MKRLVAAAAVFAALVGAGSAAAGVRVQGVDASGFPRLDVTLLAPAGSARPVLTEDGLPVSGYTAVNLGREKSIELALDRSQSMKGRPIALAVAAAQQFVSATGPQDEVGLVAFGRDAVALTRFPSSRADVNASLDGLGVDSHSGTALFDAVRLAAQRLQSDDRAGRAIVVVTDGADVSSNASLHDAIDAAHAAHAAIYTIGIAGPSFTPDTLRTLAEATGGSYHQANGARDLQRVYGDLAHELARTWQLSYLTARRPGDAISLAATVPGAGTAHLDTKLPGDGSAPTTPSSVIPSAGYSGAGTAAVGIAAGLLVLLAVCFVFAARRGERLRARIEPHLGAPQNGQQRRRRSGAAARTRVSETVERAFGGLRQFQTLQVKIDRADLPLRAGELLALSAGGALFLGMVAAVLVSSTLMILLVMAFAAAAPSVYVSFKSKARIRRFDSQLPDILITVAASLKAGHSFRQGMQSVVDEGSEPAAKEFRRVLTETQLGKPMDDALLDMTERIGSKDLTFVINAVTIQRQIGGSLAGLFDMVGDTVRQRQQFYRKVRGLTAMGRMSAYVLVGLPFFVAALITLMNPTYMQPLYHTATGQKLIVGGLVMIAIGSGILKKIASFRG